LGDRTVGAARRHVDLAAKSGHSRHRDSCRWSALISSYDGIGPPVPQEQPVRLGRTALILLVLLVSGRGAAQTPSFSLSELDRLVGRIALFPDPLLAQVLAADTFSDEIPGAAQWADQHRQLSGQALADAMQSGTLRWDPSVQALLPFPSLLARMAADTSWTTNLGDAFLAQQRDVLNSIQGRRVKARDSGRLRSNDYIVVSSGPDITILPLNPARIFVPSHDPDNSTALVHYGAGVTVGGFQPCGWKMNRSEVLGGYFQAWGWGLGGIDWETRTVIINDSPWQRTWKNRTDYVYPYPALEQSHQPNRHQPPCGAHNRAGRYRRHVREEQCNSCC
jgi:hypothetical protein